VSVLDQAPHVVGCLKDRQINLKTLLKFNQALLFEAREAAVEHQRDEVQELLVMLSDGQVCLDSACYIELIGLSFVITTKDVYEFFGKLEVCTFKTHVFAGGPIEDKAKVNVNDVPSIVNHNVAIVAVLDLKYIAHYRVGRKTFDEVEASHLEFSCMLIPKLLKEVLVQVNLKCFAKLVSAKGVRDAFDYATESLVIASSVADALVGSYKEI
jgi:hypothetical protein